MYGPRLCNEYIKGVDVFIDFAKKSMTDNGRDYFCCPCKHCKNEKKYRTFDVLKAHLIMRGFMEDYWCWNKHGEQGLNEAELRDALEREVPMGVEEEHDDMNEADMLGLSDEDIMCQVENIDEMVRNVERHADDEYNKGEMTKYLKMLEDSKKPLYPGCAVEYTRLFAMVKLFRLKAGNGWSDGSFKELLTLLKDMLPRGNLIPDTVYEAKQIICPLGLEVEKIHACKNDCILYRGEEYADLKKCPVCGLDRFNRRKDGGDDEDNDKGHGLPKKVFWYFPIIPRLKRWFANKKEAEQLRWHKEKHKDDGLIRHPADSTQWRNIDSRNPEFAKDPRNIRIAMSTDGMNPFMNNNTHSTWPIVLTIFNLPPWLCNKRKYIHL